MSCVAQRCPEGRQKQVSFYSSMLEELEGQKEIELKLAGQAGKILKMIV